MAKVMSKHERRDAINSDGWVNVLAGLGKRGDKTRATQFGDFEYIQDTELTRMWMGEGLGKKIVSVVADDMTRPWITLDGDPQNKIMGELARLNAKLIFNKAVKWARLYRGCVIVVGYNDGRKLEEPVDWNRVKGIDWLKEYPAPRIVNVQSDLVTDPASPYFEDFSYFKVFRTDGQIINAHRSRCLVFKGDPVPHLLHGVNFYYLYWGMSALQSILHQIRDLGGITTSVANLMFEAVVGKYKLSNLAQLIASNNTDQVYNRIEIINASKSIINAVLIGEDEEYTRDQVSFAGIPDTMDRFMMLLCATSDIPMTRMFGRAPAGLNATGESDLRNYYDMVGAKQESILLNPLQTLVDGMNRYIKVKGSPIVKFNPLWQSTQAEIVTMRYQQAQTDQIYIMNGVVESEEVRISRFQNGYNIETTLMDDDVNSKDKSKIPGTNTAEPDEKEEGQTGNIQKKPKYGTNTGEAPVIVKKKQPGEGLTSQGKE